MSTGAAAGAAAQWAERRLIEDLREARAVSPLSASAVPEQRWIGKRVLSRLVAAGAIREAILGYYLDEERYTAYRARRRRNVIAVITVMAVALGLVIGLANLQ